MGGRAILALEAAERGWGVIIGRGKIGASAELPRGVVIERGVAPGMGNSMRAALSQGRVLSAWCDEGLVYFDGDEYRRIKIDRDAFGLVEYFFAWGENHAADMPADGTDRAKIITSGNTRFDLHRPDFRSILDPYAQGIRRKFGRVILVNTKFSKHNSAKDLDQTIKLGFALGIIKTPEDERHLRDWADFHAVGFARFMELLPALSRRFPSHRIVVRPHPSEEAGPWLAIANTLPNVVVSREGNVAEWIAAAEASIHTNCTTGVEAYLLGKTSISYRPNSDPRFDMFLPNALSAEIFDRETVLDMVTAQLRGDVIPTARSQADKALLARHYIANIDGTPASVRTMDVLDASDIAEEPLVVDRVVDTTGIKGLGKQLINAVAGGGNRSANPDTERVSASEMRAFLAAARKATGRFGELHLAEVGGALSIWR